MVGKENEGDLPVFSIRMWNGRVSIDLEVAALARAHWTFDQPTRRLRSHLTYNEYPLEVRRLRLEDEQVCEPKRTSNGSAATLSTRGVCCTDGAPR